MENNRLHQDSLFLWKTRETHDTNLIWAALLVARIVLGQHCAGPHKSPVSKLDHDG